MGLETLASTSDSEKETSTTSERREQLFSEVSEEFFLRVANIKETLEHDPTYRIDGESREYGDDLQLRVVAEYQRLVEIAEELKQAAEYRNDYSSAEAASLYCELAESELKTVKSIIDMHTRFGETALNCVEKLRPDLVKRMRGYNDNNLFQLAA